MFQRVFKLTLTLVVFSTLLLTNIQPAFAVNCPTTVDEIDNPTPDQIVCPFMRVINTLVLSSGAMFVIMILFGAIKLSMAMGDPKGFDAAKGTMTWAVIGFLIVVGVFVILTIVTKIFGIDAGILDPFQLIQDKIQKLMTDLGIVVD